MPSESDLELLGALYERSLSEVADRQSDGRYCDDVPSRLLARYSSVLYLAGELACDLVGYMSDHEGEEAPGGQGEA